VEVLDPAAGAADGLRVVAEEVEPLLRVDHQLVAAGALEPIRTAGDSSEDVEGVHGSQDQLASVPQAQAVPAVERGVPPLEAAHANCREVAQATLSLHLYASFGVLSW